MHLLNVPGRHLRLCFLFVGAGLRFGGGRRSTSGWFIGGSCANYRSNKRRKHQVSDHDVYLCGSHGRRLVYPRGVNFDAFKVDGETARGLTGRIFSPV